MIPETNTNYASKGLAGTALGFGIGGTAMSLLSGCNGGLLGNLFNNGGCNAQVSALQAQVAKLESEKYADRNTIDLFRYQDAKNECMGQRIATLEATVKQLGSFLAQITKVVVPNSAVCPGYGGVTITPAAATTGA